MDYKKTVLKDIVFSVLLLLLFFIVSSVTLIILSFVLSVLQRWPLFNIVSWFFLKQADASPSFLLYGICFFIAITVVGKAIDAMFKSGDRVNKSITYGIMGIVILSTNIVNLICNIVYHSPVVANIMLIILGFVLFSNRKEL